MSALQQAARDLLGRRSLSEDRLRTLQTMQEQVSCEVLRPRRLRAVTRVAFAGVLVFAALAPILAWLSLSSGPGPDLPRLIANEVAENHLKLKPMEVRGAELADIRGYFTELDFLPVETGLPEARDLALLGGRYCSVQGRTAAQLRLRLEDEAPLRTLYQVAYDPHRFGPLPSLDEGDHPLNLGARGLRVRLWVEKGIMFALIGE